MGNLYLCGAGNAEGVRLAITVNRVESRWREIIVLDDDPEKLGRLIVGVAIAGPFSLLANADPNADEVVNLVTRKTKTRAVVRDKIASYGVPFASLIHPEVDTFSVTLAEDVTVYQHATLGASSTVGSGSVVLMHATVGHGARVGRNCVIAPGAVLNARVVLEDRAYFGTNATILPDLTVGEDATVGSLTSVIQNVPATATAIGVPAEIMMPAHPEDSTGIKLVVPVDPALVNQISEIWTELLGLDEVSPHDNFFDVGGTSLLALEIRIRVQTATGAELSPIDVFRMPTIQTMAEHITRKASGDGALSARRRRGQLRRVSRQLIRR